MREVGAAIALENLAVPLVHEREAQAHHLFIADGLAVHWAQRAIDAHHRRLVDLEMQIAGFELHTSAE
jgi:hypothetical protein